MILIPVDLSTIRDFSTAVISPKTACSKFTPPLLPPPSPLLPPRARTVLVPLSSPYSHHFANGSDVFLPFRHYYRRSRAESRAESTPKKNTTAQPNNPITPPTHPPKRRQQWQAPCTPALPADEMEARRSGLQTYLTALSELKESWDSVTVKEVLCCPTAVIDGTPPATATTASSSASVQVRLIFLLLNICRVARPYLQHHLVNKVVQLLFLVSFLSYTSSASVQRSGSSDVFAVCYLSGCRYICNTNLVNEVGQLLFFLSISCLARLPPAFRFVRSFAVIYTSAGLPLYLQHQPCK